MRKVVVLLTTWGGVGFSPLAPGTAGAAAAVPLFLILSLLPLWGYLLLLLVIFLLACWLAGKAEKIFHQRDSRCIVIDEVVGFLTAMSSFRPCLPSIILGFGLFRFFDIVKPPPIRLLEKRIQGGFGLVLDDVVAGIYANIVLQIFWAFLSL
jgi:phosphatidylglycerophosphatase A